jgi:hypothetical protein
MRASFFALLVALLAAPPVHAIGDTTALSVVQEDCAQVGAIAFGENQPWTDCRVTRARWVSTIELTDMYQAQYCLASAQDACAQRALLVFGNRAYTPTAQLMLQRIDPPATVYDDPQVVNNRFGRILTVTAHLADGSTSSHFYLWRGSRWVPIDAQSWRKELARRLPSGVVVVSAGQPDVDSMSVPVTLFCKHDVAHCASDGGASVELALVGERFAARRLQHAQAAQ